MTVQAPATRVAVITGSTSGIGLAIARWLDAKRCQVNSRSMTSAPRRSSGTITLR
jgi:NAD(P)-dependent dehydrogenase (short-subunit alcohol dehydrogenase family)